MGRVCMRPGCDRAAVARLSYDAISCQVWLDPLGERPGPVQEICDMHASRLTVPRGWMLRDRRALVDRAEAVEGVDGTTPEDEAASAASAPSHPAGPIRTVRPRVARTEPIAVGAPTAEEPTAPAASAEPAATTEPTELAEAPEPADAEAPEPAEVAAEVADVEEEQDPDDLPEMLQATSPLLSRAFRATGPQRSVLTHTLLDDVD